MESLPFEIQEQLVQCFGRCFHYKDAVAAFMRSCGVPPSLIAKYRNEAKFIWARRVIEELNNEQGMLVLRRMVTELCKLRNLPDQNVADKSSGIDALRTLKEIAASNKMSVKEIQQKSIDRKTLAKQKAELVQQRSMKLEQLKQKFYDGFINPNRQQAGYSLEDILYELFMLFEIEYRKPYKTPTQQIDGHFRFEGFDYLVEAKWRNSYPNEQEIGGFQQKVNNKLESTRGLFVSVQGFREEVIQQFSGRGANILFMSGQDLTAVLEGRIHLQDGLRIKIEKAAQEGVVYYLL